jgi:hypothetical protein
MANQVEEIRIIRPCPSPSLSWVDQELTPRVQVDQDGNILGSNFLAAINGWNIGYSMYLIVPCVFTKAPIIAYAFQFP